jgi:hypothetical protein
MLCELLDIRRDADLGIWSSDSRYSVHGDRRSTERTVCCLVRATRVGFGYACIGPSCVESAVDGTADPAQNALVCPVATRFTPGRQRAKGCGKDSEATRVTSYFREGSHSGSGWRLVTKGDRLVYRDRRVTHAYHILHAPFILFIVPSTALCSLRRTRSTRLDCSLGFITCS